MGCGIEVNNIILKCSVCAHIIGLFRPKASYVNSVPELVYGLIISSAMSPFSFALFQLCNALSVLFRANRPDP